MTKEKAKELLPIITAFAEGKTIQFKCDSSTDGSWSDITDIVFAYGSSKYRIKPEPREFWICIFENGVRQAWNVNPKDASCDYGKPIEIIHVKEIISD